MAIHRWMMMMMGVRPYIRVYAIVLRLGHLLPGDGDLLICWHMNELIP